MKEPLSHSTLILASFFRNKALVKLARMNASRPCGGSFLEIKNVSHFYGHKAALKWVSLEVKQGEILALLGPSGSGKSTLLSVIAGIVKPKEGKLLLDGRDLLQLPPEARGLGMVFQDFALWPHMTVAQNVAFPLRVRKYSKSETNRRTELALKRVDLEGFEGRRPHELSGGQQQRVALARAVVAETRLLLLDEPLSALDPATRSSVRSELAEILRKLGLTTIIVTHDREEAFELAGRVAVLVDGQIQQHSVPEDVYERPANLTVARFMGVNLLSVRVRSDGSAEVKGSPHRRLELLYRAGEGPVHLAIVPEKTRVAENRFGKNNVLQAQVLRIQYRGGEYRLKVRIGEPENGQLLEARSNESPRGDWLFVHLPSEALHVIKQSPFVGPGTRTADRLITDINPTKLQEEIA
jgi:putative spermidine/putrescine transport system ATP-binding protein